MKISKKNLVEILLVADDPSIFSEITDEMDLSTKIYEIERIVRYSNQYRIIVTWHKLKHNLSIDAITGYDSYEYKFTVELHHVVRLWDICEIVGRYLLANRVNKDEPITLFQVADKVIEDHNKNIIPLICLNKTAHEFHHEKLIDIPKDKIIGNWEDFLDKYKSVISEDELSYYLECLEDK